MTHELLTSNCRIGPTGDQPSREAAKEYSPRRKPETVQSKRAPKGAEEKCLTETTKSKHIESRLGSREGVQEITESHSNATLYIH